MMSLVRAIFVLGRFSVLPTVWSNCLAGWWLGGAGHADYLPFVFGGATLLYLGGAFLKDAFDVDFDRLHRPSRPIPSGRFSEATAYRLGLTLLTLGALLLLWPGHLTGALGLFSVFLIVLHNTTHRLMPVAPAIRGVCRLLLYLLGASVALRGVGGWAIWCGLALAGYTAGVGYLTTFKSNVSKPRLWPLLLLLVPIGLAAVLNVGDYRESGLLLSAVVAIWALRTLRYLYWTKEPAPERVRAALIAGIVFVDWLATCPLNLPNPLGEATRQLSFVFLGLFGLTLLLQRIERKC